MGNAHVLGAPVPYLLHGGVPLASAATAAALPPLVAGLFFTPHVRYFAYTKVLRNGHFGCCLRGWVRKKASYDLLLALGAYDVLICCWNLRQLQHQTDADSDEREQ
jgi:hypothetical protein